METLQRREYFVIERAQRSVPGRQFAEKEQVARVPFENGAYHTDSGVLGIAFQKPDQRNLLKVIVSGDVVPTVKKRGKKGQFQSRGESEPRRVVSIPEGPGKTVSQDVTPDEVLLFRVEKVIYTDEGVASATNL